MQLFDKIVHQELSMLKVIITVHCFYNRSTFTMASNFVALFLLLLLYCESCCAVGGSVEVCLHEGTHNCSLADSLDEALGSLSSGSTVSLSPGLHVIQTFNLIRDLTNIRISGNDTTSSVTIECTAGAGLAFFNISGLVIENLNINRCGLSGSDAILELRDVLHDVVDGFFLIPNDTKLAVFLGVCANVTMDHVAIANTTGLGLMGINVMGEFSLSEVDFESNNNQACFTNRLAQFTPDSLGSQIGGGAFIVYHRFHATNNDPLPQYVNLSIRQTSFIRNADCSPNTFVELYYQFSPGLRDIGYIVGGGGGLTLMVAQCNYTIDARINSSTFQGNTARYGSGAHIGIFNDATNCHVRFTNCTFIGNGLPPDMFPGEQGGSGVAILNDLISPYHGLSRPTVHNKNVFINIEFSNFTENTGYAGAGVYVYSQHSTATVRNDSDATIVMCSHCLFRSNSASLGPAFFANALKLSALIPGVQIGLLNITAVENFVAPLENGSFRSVSDSSAVIDIRRVEAAMNGLQIIENRGTGLLGTLSMFLISGNVTISGNIGEFGGGMRLMSFAFILLQRNATIIFKDNTGIVRGGAVYVVGQDDPTVKYSDCFIYIGTFNVLRCQSVTRSALERTGIRIEFSGNYAPVGSTIYGSTLNTCCWARALRDEFDFNGTIFEALYYIAPDLIQFDSTPTGVEEITTLPNNLVVSHNHSTIIPGQSITISVAAFDQFDQYAPTVVTSTVLYTSHNATSLIGISGYYFLRQNRITNIPFRIFGPENQTVTVGIYSIDSFADTQFTIQVSQCSPGFIYNHSSSSCNCIEELIQEGINCNMDTQSLEVPNHLWMGPVNKEDNTVDLVHECVLDYCHPGSRIVPPSEYKMQCAEGYSRTGLLCGTCVQGYSIVFGTNRCLKCSNTYIVLIVVFIMAGILLALAISLLKITVAHGYLNGILFYCNVISLYTTIYPGDSTSFIIISFLNINLGVEACFYDGMDALARTGLQLVFPAYLFLLMGLITVLARSKYRCSKCFINSKFNANEMFGTLLILCYSSILESCIEILGVVRIQTLAGDTLIRWVVDPTVPYFHGWHGVLGAIAIILVLLYTALFPLVLLFPTYVYQYLPKLKPFFDALYNPFKKEFRFWLAFRLILRSIPLVLAVFVRYPLNVFILAIFLIVLHYIQLFAKPFQMTAVNITDGFLLMNAIILTVGALFFDSALNTASEENQSTILTQHTSFSYAIISTAYAIFLCILLYYIYLRMPEKLRNTIKDKSWKLSHCLKKNTDEGEVWTPMAENRSAPQWTTTSVSISRMQRADDMEPTPRIPLLDQSHQGQ